MCPNCREPMVVVELEGVELDRCVACRGTWLDAGELEQIVALAGVAPGPLTAAVRTAGAGRRGQRRCPRCRRKMRILEVGQQPRIELDRCPIGHGLWFDSGELRTTVQEFAGGEAGVVAQLLADLFRFDLSQPADGG